MPLTTSQMEGARMAYDICKRLANDEEVFRDLPMVRWNALNDAALRIWIELLQTQGEDSAAKEATRHEMCLHHPAVITVDGSTYQGVCVLDREHGGDHSPLTAPTLRQRIEAGIKAANNEGVQYSVFGASTPPEVRKAEMSACGGDYKPKPKLVWDSNLGRLVANPEWEGNLKYPSRKYYPNRD